MIHGIPHKKVAIALLFSQLAVFVVGGPFMVRCQNSSGRDAIKYTRVNSYEQNQFALSGGQAANALNQGQIDNEQCVDTPLAYPSVVRQSGRLSLAAAPVVLVCQVAELSQVRSAVFRGPIHVFSPDSAESLAGSVILLI